LSNLNFKYHSQGHRRSSVRLS